MACVCLAFLPVVLIVSNVSGWSFQGEVPCAREWRFIKLLLLRLGETIRIIEAGAQVFRVCVSADCMVAMRMFWWRGRRYYGAACVTHLATVDARRRAGVLWGRPGWCSAQLLISFVGAPPTILPFFAHNAPFLSIWVGGWAHVDKGSVGRWANHWSSRTLDVTLKR